MITAADVMLGRILIVDDKPANVVLLERMLRGAGYSQVTASSQPTAVFGLHVANKYDLIILDLQMPGMDGFAVMEQLKTVETDGYLPVLVLTAAPDQKLRALKAGARDFVSKPFELAEVLLRVYNMVEVRLLHLQSKRHAAELEAEQKVSDRLLRDVLPHAIAERLKDRPADSFSDVIADNFDDVTVLFADIVGFTQFSQTLTPQAMLRLLNDLFTRFDVIAEQRGMERIKTIGDAYMAVAGLPVPVADHSVRAAHMALDMMDAVEQHNVGAQHKLKVRIGLSTGAVVVGVIGKRKFLYDVWGETVNSASRMESHGVTGRIQLADSTRARLAESFSIEEREPTQAKDPGEVRTWFLNGRHDGTPES